MNDRPTNLQRRANTDSTVLTLEDAPATARIRTANVYDIGQTISLCATAQHTAVGTPAQPHRFACTVLSADTGTQTRLEAEGGTAKFVPDIPGDHWYRFDAFDNAGNMIATSERFFIVRKPRVPR